MRILAVVALLALGVGWLAPGSSAAVDIAAPSDADEGAPGTPLELAVLPIGVVLGSYLLLWSGYALALRIYLWSLQEEQEERGRPAGRKA